MAMCKECIHNNVCRNYEPISYSACSDFKDKSRYIELPCKVGDKVYFDTYLHENSVGVQSHKVINVKYVITTEPWKGGIGAEIYDYYFGKTVFLTREEAEKALKNRN